MLTKKGINTMENPYNEIIGRAVELEKIWDEISDSGLKIRDFIVKKIIIEVSNIEDLSAARRLAKKVYPDWKDSISIIYESSGNYVVCWKSSADNLINIELSAPLGEFPEQLKKEGCGFKKTESIEYDYICEV